MQCKSELTILTNYLSSAALFCMINEKDRINAKSPKKNNKRILFTFKYIIKDIVQNIQKPISEDSRLLNK